jgi:anaerobic selenocysteine-containing dehydrogenase
MLQRRRTTCPRDCYDGCGIVVELDGDRIARVLGDPEHPVSRGKLCGKCALAYNGVWRDPAARLAHPLRRVGAKGSGRFAPATWDEVLAEIAQRLQQVCEQHGAQSILHAHYTGTCSLLAGEFPMRFFNRLGATEVAPDTICNNAGHVALDYVYGTSTLGFDPKTIRDAHCVVIWGANPSASAPHVHEHWLDAAPGEIIVVDPVRHATAEKADLHVQPFPGSDAALAFGLMHVIWRAGLADAAYLEAHSAGFEELLVEIEKATPRWTAEATGIEAATLEHMARCYAGGPSLLWLGQGLQRQPQGGNVMRACAALPAITGNLGKPGAGLLYLNGDGPRNIDGEYLSAPQLRRVPEASLSHMDLAEALADPLRARAFFCWNMNVAASGPRQQALRRALAREDLFSVVIDLFQTETADYADIVLPAASFLEFDDLVVPYFHLLISAQVKLTAPPGEALPNQEIFRRLARAMGFAEAPLFEPDREIIDALLARSGLGIEFDTLAARGSIDPFPEPVIAFADGRFPTPSGRIELASARAEADGHPRVPVARADTRPVAGELRLLSPANAWLMNDSYANDANVRGRLGKPSLTLNPQDAQRAGLAAGDLARVHNATGELSLRVAISDVIQPGVALAHKGRWAKLDGASGNINTLNPGERTDMGESSSVHGALVRVEPA